MEARPETGRLPLARRSLGIAATVAILLTASVLRPDPAVADVTLTNLGQSAHWSGSISNGVVPIPEVCTPLTCQSYDVTLDLPEDSWAVPGGLLVSLRWPDTQLDAGYDLDLYVYGPDGTLAARSNMVIYSSAEGTWVQNPPNGVYRVVVVPKSEIGTSPYDLFVNLTRGYTVHTTQTNLTSDPTGGGLTPYTPDFVFLGEAPDSPQTLLPDLVPAKPADFHIETTASASFYVGADRGLRHQPSCYPQETTGVDADQPGSQASNPLRCFRFSSSLMNLGAGPFELRAYPNDGNGTDAYQAIYKTDGTYDEPKVGNAIFSNAHGHIHFEGFEETGLYTINPEGTPGALVAKMPDKGRCAVDTGNAAFGARGDGPAHYFVPSTCDQNDNQDPNDPVYPNGYYFRSGISPGWQDTYPWFILDQYIDITNVPDGRYLLIERVNISGVVAESDTENDTAEACVEFHGTTVTECAVVSP